MSDTVTIVGRVGTDPVPTTTAGGAPMVTFRLASTHRRFDTTTQSWMDGTTNWFSVAAYRQLGEHASESLRTGDSVIVVGRLRIRDWESNGRRGTSVDIDAETIGHDLRWGTTAYRPRHRTVAGAGAARANASSEPAVRESEPPDDWAVSAAWTDVGGEEGDEHSDRAAVL